MNGEKFNDEPEVGEIERQTHGYITYAPGVTDSRPHQNRSRRRSTSLSIHRAARRSSLDPGLVLPPQYRTLSYGIEENQRKHPEKRKSDSKRTAKPSDIQFGDLDNHTATLDELLTRFCTSRSTGLTSSEAASLLKKVGRNQITPPPSRWLRKFIGYLYGGFGAILFIAAILVFIAWRPLGDPPAPANLGLAIVLVIVWVIQAAFSFWQDFSSSRVMASITGMLPDQCIVLRDSAQQQIDGRDIVPGDLLKITIGNRLPADVRFVEVSSDARFDRSILTGETIPLLGSVESTDPNYLETACIGMAGTHCVSGSAWGLVLETGDNTVFGRIAKLTSAPDTGLTPLQKEILYFVLLIVGLMLTFIVIVIIFWATWLRKKYPEWISVAGLIVDCVSVAVAFIPEGLPIAVTASLTIVAGVLKKNKVLCKSLKTVETLGAVNVICSDKTGTLTRNQMIVTDCMVGKQVFPVSESQSSDALASNNALQRLVTLVAVCNDAEFLASTMNAAIPDRKINGDATDSSMLRFVEGILPVAQIRADWRYVFKVAFNSKNKFAVTVSRPQGSKETTLMIKGAPDILLPRCGSYLSSAGFVERLDDDDRSTIEEMKNRWSAQGRRVILLAEKRLEEEPFDATRQPREYEQDILGQAMQELVLVGLVAISDPPRQEIPHVIDTLRGAGIRVFMVTGDFKLTAAAIATQCGIIKHDPRRVHDVSALTSNLKSDVCDEKRSLASEGLRSILLSGSDLEDLEDSQWDRLCAYDEVVFARTTPDHKLKIVKELQARGNTVGMTGDGVNDAPSLKAADIGIAMGSGSDIAIEAADMVLLDSFAAIVEAVKYGRVVYDNLKKTVCYLLPAGSFSEFWPVFTNIVFGLPQVLSSFEMIVICCLTDCGSAIALAYEKPEADVLTRPPRNAKKDRLVDWRLVIQAYGFIGVCETVCSFAMAYWYAQRAGLPFGVMFFSFSSTPGNLTAEQTTSILNTASSIYFVNLVVMQWFNLCALRTRRLSLLGHRMNWYLIPAVIFALLITIFFLYVPQFHGVLGTAVVPVAHWFLPMGFGLGLLLLDEGRKSLVRRFPNGPIAKMAW